MKHKLKTKVLLILAAVLSLAAGMSAVKKSEIEAKVARFYRLNADSLNTAVLHMKQHLADGAMQESLQEDFIQARIYYKRIEAFVEYHLPESAIKINGANLVESEPSLPEEPILPTGFQVLEEVVYAEEPFDRQAAKMEIDGLAFACNRARVLGANIEFSEANILDALKLNLYRLITKGISGFDAPVALNSLPEAVVSLAATQQVLNYFPQSGNMQAATAAALDYVQMHQDDFDGFDRAKFIAGYINPLSVLVYDYQLEHKIPFIQAPNRAIPANIPHLFSPGAIDLSFYAPAGAELNNKELAALGKILFEDKRLSVANNRSCATCHIPSKAFTDGLALNESLVGGKKLMRNTPSLINAAYQPVQFSDSRITFLEDQIHDVIANPEEMGGRFEQIRASLAKDKVFMKAYKAAFAGKKPAADEVKKALAAYVRTLSGFNSAFDRYMQGEQTAMTAEQINGFNLFMGKAKCGTCHFMPTFTGAAPPYYEKMESEVLGVPQSNDTLNPKMDTDPGKFQVYGMPHHLYSFKTATVRNAAVTAPYMHNGALKTLRELIDFYNRGGGQGLGFELEHQTLPGDLLHLTEQEKKNIEAFIGALTDTVSYKKVQL